MITVEEKIIVEGHSTIVEHTFNTMREAHVFLHNELVEMHKLKELLGKNCRVYCKNYNIGRVTPSTERHLRLV